MANFETAFKKTIINEGFYSNDESDYGGETIFGISRRYNKSWDGWDIVDENKNNKNFPKILIDNQDLLSLIKILYKTKYWDYIKGDDIINQELANKFFDTVVQPGFISVKLMQRSILDITKDRGFVADGIVGVKTLRYLNNLDVFELLNIFKHRLVTYYAECSDNHKFIRGWIKRAMS